MVSAYGNIERDNQFLLLDGNLIHGAQDLKLDIENPIENIRTLGLNREVYSLIGPKISQANLTANLISDDQLSYLTGETGINLFVFNERGSVEENFGLEFGFLTSYSLSYDVGNLPAISTAFDFFGKAGVFDESMIENLHYKNQFEGFPSSNPTGIFREIVDGCTDISMNEFNSNALLSYNISINCPRSPIYAINKKNPIKILHAPIQVSVDLNIEVNDIEFKNNFSYPTSTQNKNISISINDKNNNLVKNFNFGSMVLKNQSIDYSNNKSLGLSLKYEKTIFRK